MNKKSIAKETFLIISSFLVGGVVMLAIVHFTPLVESIIGSKNNYVITKNDTKVYEKNSLAASVAKVYDAVVLIQGYNNGNVNNSGTGFVYKVDHKYGYILTNEHVIKNSETINITTTSDEEGMALVLGKDVYLDIAVLRVDKKYVKMVAELGKSETMNLGDSIFTVGSPLGYDYRGSVTSGVLSGKDRLVTIPYEKGGNEESVVRVLQIDASINPGNSGGPLLNVNGEVIGICSMKLVDDTIEGMGFAIPIEYAISHVETLEKGQKIKWPFLGITMVNTTESSTLKKNNIKISSDINEGVVVINIKENSGAAKSDLKKGDIITKINESKVKNVAYLKYELYQYQAGDTIEVTYIRNGITKKTKITLTDSINE